MGEEIAVSLNNVSKCFKRYARPVDRLKELLLPHKSYAQEFWALRDISFEIMKGETMGIIGRNGAGKSTLLQLICGTLKPTNGEVQVNGRVAALLELGAGFNPEFTGRENVYMNGAIMGLSKTEVNERFDNVAAFADIKDFIDQPVKTYSSGMYVRLAFASAIHVDPDILIVDEALAVGDMFFQAKCMARMRRMMESGVTVLFVSHDTASVKSLCQRGVFLENGELKKMGNASDVVEIYVSNIRNEMNQQLNEQLLQSINDMNFQDKKESDIQLKQLDDTCIFTALVQIDRETEFAEGSYRYGDGGATILDAKILNKYNQIIEHVDYREDFSIQVSIIFKEKFPTFCFGYLVKDVKGMEIIGATNVTEKILLPAVEAGDIYIVETQISNILNAGIYTITFGVEIPVITNQQHIYLDVLEDGLVFEVNRPENPLDRFWSKVYASVSMKYIKI